jgi:hypothetical protein
MNDHVEIVHSKIIQNSNRTSRNARVSKEWDGLGTKALSSLHQFKM